MDANGMATTRRTENRSIELLLGIVTGIIADSHLHDLEIQMLSTWLSENEYAASVWPGCVIAERVRTVLADGIVTDEERAHLLSTLQGMAACDFANTGSASAEVVQLPLQDDGDVQLRDNHVCLTGAFIYGTRASCERVCTEHGALPVSAVSKKVLYLIVGTNVSPAWAHTSYGRKIEQAMTLRQAGHPIRVISERRWNEVTKAM